MGKMMATEPEDEKDPKRARVVLSKGCEVVRLGYSRLIGTATKVADMRENSGNHSQVNWVNKTEQHYPSRVSWVGLVTKVSQNSSIDRRTDQVSRVGNTEQKIGGSGQVANTEIWVTENSANIESRVAQNLANTESRVTEDSANMENQVMQDSGGGAKNQKK
jgi:hypothetical protein